MSEANGSKATSGMAIAGLVLGILAAVSSWIPIINNFSFIVAVIGLVFAIVGVVGTVRGKKAGKGIAIAALVINLVAAGIVLATQSAMSAAIDDATSGLVSTEDVTVQQQEGSEAPDGSDGSDADAADQQAYAISDVQMTGDEFSVTISGTFTNNSGTEVSYVQVSYRLLDAEGAQIGTAYANTNNLPAGGTWKFEAMGFEPLSSVASYELADVTGF